jgi:hypothetical protein
MATDDTTVEESREQPLEDSTQEDQPDTGESSEESTELLDDDKESTSEEDQPEEESDEEEKPDTFEIDGEELSLEDLKQGYMRNKDYTQKTQALADMKKGLDEKPKKELSPEEKQVMEFLSKYGIVTEEALTKKMSLEQAKLTDMQNFNAWKSGSSATADKAEAVYNLGKSFPKMSYPEIEKKFFGDSVTRKVVKRKVVGMKGKGSGKKAASGGFTREQIAKMSPEVYAKNSAAIKEALRKGEIK